MSNNKEFKHRLVVRYYFSESCKIFTEKGIYVTYGVQKSTITTTVCEMNSAEIFNKITRDLKKSEFIKLIVNDESIYIKASEIVGFKILEFSLI